MAAQLRSHYHLDDPFLVQYLRYLGGILHGDLGRAYSGLPVSAVLAHAFPVTIRLALIALAVEAVLGIGFGVIAGLRQGGIFDSAVLVTGLVIIAIPIFVLGFLAQFLFGVSSKSRRSRWANGRASAACCYPGSCWAPCHSPTWCD